MENYGVVSIIMPVYGVEKYLPQCLESVCNQTYPYLEIIVVDDESPDNSGKIAEEFAQKDSRIKVLHIKNRGAAGARNIALDICTGKYVFFVDSDDWIDKDMVELLINRMVNDNSQIAQCQYIDEYLNESLAHSYIESDKVCTDEEFVKDMISKWEYIINCNKIYLKDIIKDIRFIEGGCIDDEFFTYKVICNSSRISLSRGYYYHYRMRKSSAMRNPEKEKQRFNDQIDFVTIRYNDIKNAYPSLKSKFACHLAEVLMFVMRNGFEYKDVFSRAKSELKKHLKDVILDKGIEKNIKKSVLMYLIKNNFASDSKTEIQDINSCFE